MPGEGIRAIDRDVFFYDLKDLSTQLGGLVLTRGITNANFYAMINIVLVISSAYFLQNDNGDILPRDAEPLLPGNYFIVADGTINVNDRLVVPRSPSRSTGTRLRSFKKRVRERDGRCVVSKVESNGLRGGFWIGFEAAHIVPIACGQLWRNNDFGNLITIPPPPPNEGDTINSVQNGLLLQSTIHQLFETYIFSINPDVSVSWIHFSFHPVYLVQLLIIQG
jgi:hypothetical protein